MNWQNETDNSNEGVEPNWFKKYTSALKSRNVDLLSEVLGLSILDEKSLSKYLGGNIRDLPYETLETLFINGSEDLKVAEILRAKREQYLKFHPEKSHGVAGAGQGIITFDGRFIPQSLWLTATDSEKRGALVGSTCFHYNSGTPGMDSNPDDRF